MMTDGKITAKCMEKLSIGINTDSSFLTLKERYYPNEQEAHGRCRCH